MTRTVGILMVIAAAAICLIGSLWLAANVVSGSAQLGGTVLGFALLFIVLVAPLGGFGIVTLMRGRAEQSETEQADEMRKILDMVKTRGRVNVSDVVIELKTDTPTIQNMIYRLVGMGVFSGYVNWDEGVLYSEDASALHDMTQCKHCGGNLTLVGKGVIKCPYCGTEYFLAH